MEYLEVEVKPLLAKAKSITQPTVSGDLNTSLVINAMSSVASWAERKKEEGQLCEVCNKCPSYKQLKIVFERYSLVYYLATDIT